MATSICFDGRPNSFCCLAPLVNNSFHQERLSLRGRLKRRLRSTHKQQKILQKKWQIAQKWEELLHEADLLKSSFHLLRPRATELVVTDWLTQSQRCIPLRPDWTAQENLAKKYKQARRLQRSLPHLEKELLELENSQKRWEELLALCESITSPEELSQLTQRAALPLLRPTSKHSAPLPFRRFVSNSGLEIWVGRSAKENEALTFHYAHGSDWWLHVHDYPGSHVVIRCPKQKELDQETLQDGCQLALYYSKAKEQSVATICVAQRKFLSKPKGGKVGQVLVSKHTLMAVRLDAQRLAQLKSRGSVAQDLS